MSRLAQKPVQRNKTADKPVTRQAPRPEEQKAARKPAFMQAKLAVSQPGDAQEREADQVAAEVIRSPKYPIEYPKRTQVSPEPTASVASNRTPLPAGVEAALATAGKPLPATVQRDMETNFGDDFSDVMIHTGAAADQSCRELDARAYTAGRDIVFGNGEFAPETEAGRELLAHELTHVVQQRGGGISSAGPASNSTADSAGISRLQRKVKANPVKRLQQLDLIGDGTAAHPGISLGDLQTYAANQADWFSEPSLTGADRKMVWDMLLDLDTFPALLDAAFDLSLVEVAGLSAADQTLLDTFITGFDDAGQTIRLRTTAATLAEAKAKGAVMLDLAAFVPAPVLRVVIPESGLNFLLDKKNWLNFSAYFKLFKPTLETPKEWQFVEQLLATPLQKHILLLDWISDLHMFTPATLEYLSHNVADFERAKPVLLILFSASDHNSAFLQGEKLEAAVTNDKNLALIIQGKPNLGALTTQVTEVANRYGEQEVESWIPFSSGQGKLGQLMIAGHGEDTRMDMAVAGANPVDRDKYVEFPGDNIEANTANTQALIDTALARMDPKAARIVFAGCLVGSHEFPQAMNLADLSTAAATLRSHIGANQNLREFVQARMAALGITGEVLAARASARFEDFSVDAGGKTQLLSTLDPAIDDSALGYVLRGAEPEGFLRATLETYADARYGPTRTTEYMRLRLNLLAGEKEWFRTQTRSALQIALPATSNVLPATLLDLSHRVRAWLNVVWADTKDIVASLVAAVRPAEAATVYGGMLASEQANLPHLKIVVEQAWMSVDIGHAPNFMAALDASSLPLSELRPLLYDVVVYPRLADLLKISGSPSHGQILLALAIAMKEGSAMPNDAMKFLRTAAGGSATQAFPAALGLPGLMSASDEYEVLTNIGLAPGMSAASGASQSSQGLQHQANLDLNHNGLNERFAVIQRESLEVLTSRLNIRARPALDAPILGVLGMGAVVRVMGKIGNWSLIDADGRVGFVRTAYLSG